MVDKLLTILKHISEIIADGSRDRAILQDIVEFLSESLNVEVCSIYIYDKSSDELVLNATCGLALDSVGNVRMHSGEGLTGYSFAQQKILNIKNPEKHPNFVYFDNSGEDIYHSFLSVPLIAGGIPVGILVIQRKTPEEFSGIIVDMAKSLSSQLAHLIINVHLIKELSDEQLSDSGSQKNSKLTTQVLLMGTPLNTGIAKGKAHIFTPVLSMEHIEHSEIDDVEAEIEIFNNAVSITKKKTIELEQTAFSMISEVGAAIFHVHLLFLDDKAVIDAVKKDIAENSHSVEFSLKQVFLRYQNQFMKMKDNVFREKLADLKDVLLRLCETVNEIKSGSVENTLQPLIHEHRILIANELLPSDLIKLPLGQIDGIICRKGGVAAHAAILARALNLPAVVGVKGALDKIEDGDDLILDSVSGNIYLNPTDEVTEQYAARITPEEVGGPDIKYPKGPALTADGTEVVLRANISLLCETGLLEKYGACGIGLYRTEFLYMIRDYCPNEEEQFSIFKRIIEAAKGEEVNVRVLDVGADKAVNYMNLGKEENPALGNRGVRVLLANRELLKEHLRAILRAAVFGKLKLNFPMVTNVEELLELKKILNDVENELHLEHLDYSEDYKIGIMLEVPAAVMGIKRLIKHIDFMSIGSNDLQQYTFAVDRTNADVAHLANPLHPVFLEMLKSIGDQFAENSEKELSICGEMAGNKLAAPLLLGAGITDLSMSPRFIPEIKEVISKFTMDQCKKMLNDVITFDSPDEVKEYMQRAMNS
jgi:phosphotransferase system enzyme I (PtsP)